MCRLPRGAKSADFDTGRCEIGNAPVAVCGERRRAPSHRPRRAPPRARNRRRLPTRGIPSATGGEPKPRRMALVTPRRLGTIHRQPLIYLDPDRLAATSSGGHGLSIRNGRELRGNPVRLWPSTGRGHAGAAPATVSGELLSTASLMPTGIGKARQRLRPASQETCRDMNETSSGGVSRWIAWVRGLRLSAVARPSASPLGLCPQAHGV